MTKISGGSFEVMPSIELQSYCPGKSRETLEFFNFVHKALYVRASVFFSIS